MDQDELTATTSIQLLKEALTDPRRTAATTAHYLASLLRLHRRLKSQQLVHRVDLWARLDSLVPILKSYRNSTRKYYTAVILVALRKWPQARAKWLPIFYEMTENLERRQSTGTRSRRELRNWITPHELQDQINQLEKQVKSMHSANTAAKRRILFNHLALRFMTDMPSLRTENMRAKIVKREDDDADGNVLLSTDHGKTYCLLLRKYKTVRSHGEQRIELPPKLCQVVRHSLKLYPRKWLLSLLTDANRGMSPNLISPAIWKNLDRQAGNTRSLLREILTVNTLS